MSEAEDITTIGDIIEEEGGTDVDGFIPSLPAYLIIHLRQDGKLKLHQKNLNKHNNRDKLKISKVSKDNKDNNRQLNKVTNRKFRNSRLLKEKARKFSLTPIKVTSKEINKAEGNLNIN